MRVKSLLLAAALAAMSGLSSAVASPWAEVGNNQLRADIELLQAAGVIDTITTHWPLPWHSITAALEHASLAAQPAAVRNAAERVLARAHAAAKPGWRARGSADATNLPSIVYGFDGMGRGKGQAQLSLEGIGNGFAGRVSLGAFAQDFHGRGFKLMPDGTYFSADVAGARIYGGYLDQWWGPGQISALSVSNNARPMPQIGIERASTDRSPWPLLNLLGPFQAEFFLGYLDGPRLQSDTYFNGLRFTVEPLKGLEIGFTRVEEFCGQGHRCSPIKDYFHFSNNPLSINSTNDQIDLDIKYSNMVGRTPFQFYTQIMDEDYSILGHPVASHFVGASLFVQTGENPVKLTAEYTDSMPTVNLFSFGDVLHGAAYNNFEYPDGLRYRGRTLGFSLDSDSTLLSLQANWRDTGGRFYEISLHHVAISDPLNTSGNVITTAPVHVRMGEARIGLPWNDFRLDVAGRLQGDQPRPHSGFAAAIEMGLRADL